MTHKYEEANKHFKSMGIEVEGVKVNWQKTQENKDGIVKSLTNGIEMLFKKNKVEYKKGSGAFVDKNTM